MEAPLCRQCGGLFTNPAATQCRFCGFPAHASPPAPMAMPMARHYQHAVQAGGKTSFFWLRIAVIAIAIVMSVVGACVSALAGG